MRTNLINSLIYKLFIVFSFFTLFPSQVYSHSGRTDAFGGHNCYVGSCAGTYHYHNGGYTPPARTYVPTPVFPINTNATWTWSSNLNETYDLVVELDDTNPTEYSAVLSKCKGCDPGPLTDFYTNKFKFEDVAPGIWYMNVKKEGLGRWSNTVYWTIEVPDWVPPSPSPTPVVINNTNPPVQHSSSNSDFAFMVILFLVLGFFLYAGYRGLKWFINYAKNNDWVYGVLFWLGLIGLSLLFSGNSTSNKSSNESETKSSGYICNCSKTCPNLTCDEAYFQLEECGCSVRDGDGDGVPCEAQCR